MYTWEDFKKEHSPEIVQKFEHNFRVKKMNDGEPTRCLEDTKFSDLSTFVGSSFPWQVTNEGHQFWLDVANGNHIKTQAASDVDALAEKMNSAFARMRAAWGDFTMAVGLAIIDGRWTPGETNLRTAFDSLSETHIKARGLLGEAIRERDEAVKRVDDLLKCAQAAVRERDEAIDEREHYKVVAEAQGSKYNRLCIRHSKLRLQLKAPKRKAAKAKRSKR